MATFTAYFDESGTHDDSTVIFVAGILGKDSSWRAISCQWQSVLNKFGVTACHARDLYHNRGEFCGWGQDKRESFLRKLFSVIATEPLKSIGCGLNRDLFNRVSNRFPDVPLTPYAVCVDWCMIYTAGGIAMRNRRMEPIVVVFEDGPKNNTPAYKHNCLLTESQNFRVQFKIKQILRQPKKGVIPFQVADLFVYELYKHDTSKTLGTITKPRYPLKEFGRLVPSFGGRMTEAELIEYFDLYSAYMKGTGSKFR